MTSEKVARFSDLNAYHTFIQARAAATLTAASVTISAGSVVAGLGLLPKPDGANQFIVLFFLSLLFAILYCFRAFATGHALEQSAVERLSALQLPEGADLVDCKLRKAFIAEFRRKHHDLRTAAVFLCLTCALAGGYLVLIFQSRVITKLFATSEHPFLYPVMMLFSWLVFAAIVVGIGWFFRVLRRPRLRRAATHAGQNAGL